MDASSDVSSDDVHSSDEEKERKKREMEIKAKITLSLRGKEKGEA